MFSFVSLDSKTVLPVLLIIAAVGIAWWTFTKGNQNAAASQPSATDQATANAQSQLTSLAIISALLNPQSSAASSNTGAITSGTSATGQTTYAVGNTGLSTSQATYTAPATSNQTGGQIVTQGAG